MAGKKGKGGFTLTSLMVKCLYFPMYIFLWVMLDIIPLFVDLKKKPEPGVKKHVKFFTEFRFVLMDYFSWQGPPSNPKRCKGCFNDARWWCVDCKKKFCPDCTARLHFPGTLTDCHSIEELTDNWSKQGVHLLSPILPAIMFFIVFLTFFTGRVEIFHEDYLNRLDICPVVAQGRGVVSYLDAHLFYYLKDQFASWCNREDSFWRLLGDAWVRGVVTEADSTLLVFMNLPQALLFEVVVILIVIPILSAAYAVIVNVVYEIELLIPQTAKMQQIEKITNMFDVTTWKLIGFGYKRALADMEKKAPQTKERKRGAQDSMDAFSYWLNRKTRYLRYFYDTTSKSIAHFMWQISVFAVLFRLACIYCGLDRPVRIFCSSIGLRSVIARHILWFKGGAGQMLVNDSHIWSGFSFFNQVFSNTPTSISHSATLLAKLWFLAWLVLAVGISSVSYYCAKQREAFWVEWKTKGEHGGPKREIALNFQLPEKSEMKPERRKSVFDFSKETKSE